MSQLWDVRFNEGGRYLSNSGVTVNSLVVNLNHRGSDLFIFSILSPVTLFSAYQCTWNFVPSVEGFHEITDMCIWEVYLLLRTSVGKRQIKHTPANIALNRRLWEANCVWQIFGVNEVFQVYMRIFRNQLQAHQLLCCVIFFTIFLSVISFPTCHYIFLILRLVSFHVLFLGVI